MRLFSTKTLVMFSLAYVGVLVCCGIALALLPTFEEVGHLSQGCYLTDALVAYAECRGFFAAPFVKLLLNVPFQLLYFPIFGAAVVADQRAESFPFLAIGLALWTPIIYLCWRTIRRVAT